MTGKRREIPEADRPVVEPPRRVVDLGGRVPELPRIDRVWVRVEVAHDGLYADSVHEVGLSQRIQALINIGYLEIVAPPAGTQLV